MARGHAGGQVPGSSPGLATYSLCDHRQLCLHFPTEKQVTLGSAMAER